MHSTQKLNQTTGKPPSFLRTTWEVAGGKHPLLNVILPEGSILYHLKHISRYRGKRRHPVPQERSQKQAISARRNHSALLPCSLSTSKTPSEKTRAKISQHPFLLGDLSRRTSLETCFVTSLPRKHHIVAQCLKKCIAKSCPLTILSPAFHLQLCILSATYGSYVSPFFCSLKLLISWCDPPYLAPASSNTIIMAEIHWKLLPLV